MSTHHENAISVIICNYNYGHFVRDGLESLADQSHLPWHLIIVDDGSTDDSRAVIADFLSTKGHLFAKHDFLVNERNLGKLACVNQAVQVLSAPFVLILDADDFLPADAVERLLARILAVREENPDIGFVYSDSYLVDETGAIIGRGKSTDWSFELLRTHSYIPECALTLSCALQKASPFDESIRVSTKHHKWTKIADDGWVGHYIPEPLFNYRMHQDNISGIGQVVLNEDNGDARKERLLSGYWRTADSNELGPSSGST